MIKSTLHLYDCVKCIAHVLQLFGGFIVNLSSIGEWISWLKYISVIKYGFSVSFSVFKFLYFMTT